MSAISQPSAVLQSRRRFLANSVGVATGAIAHSGTQLAHAADDRDALSSWKNVWELDERRDPVQGSAEALCDAIGRGADLRIGTAFRHNEHVDTASPNNELVREHMDFRVTYLLDNRWVAGIETLRIPVSLPDGFGPRPSMSFFLYNQAALVPAPRLPPRAVELPCRPGLRLRVGSARCDSPNLPATTPTITATMHPS